MSAKNEGWVRGTLVRTYNKKAEISFQFFGFPFHLINQNFEQNDVKGKQGNTWLFSKIHPYNYNRHILDL